MSAAALPSAPSRLLGADGAPAFGRYQGIADSIDWRPLARGPWQKLQHRLHHKRWQYAAFAHSRFFIACAVVDVGWTGAAFAYVFDRQQGQVAAAASVSGLPGLPARVDDAAFGDASFARGARRFAFRRDGGSLRLTVHSPELRLEAEISLQKAPPVLLAVAPANYLAHSTHKSGGLTASGRAYAAGNSYRLDQAVASLDYSNGLLARETRWRWASAHGRELGFNLQQGYMGAAENALWLDGRLFPVGEVSFDYQPDAPLQPWRIRSQDGLVDLLFTPEGARREDKDLLIAMSRYVQPIGRFDGALIRPDTGQSIPVEHLLGVTEDHVSRW
ncbi:hypothetical protein CEK28_13565 [Xenophilus sp. AP218F]|nr:hypothetical protein CEK28_13565 [Xenophilus sp. AP218F]